MLTLDDAGINVYRFSIYYICKFFASRNYFKIKG